MAFWSGERLLQRLPAEKLIVPFHAAQIDCAAYQLTLGGQAFVTKEWGSLRSAIARRLSPRAFFPGLHTLKKRDPVSIPPGQFAFLATREKVVMPADSIGFISIKARHKLRGLINVSGFHVDPGWSGPLIFGVFNAGAEILVFRQGDPLFLIFFADLDRRSEKLYAGKSNYREIPTDLLQAMGPGVPSLQNLTTRMEKLTNRVKVMTAVGTVMLASVAAIIGLAAKFVPSISDIQKFVDTARIEAPPGEAGVSAPTEAKPLPPVTTKLPDKSPEATPPPPEPAKPKDRGLGATPPPPESASPTDKTQTTESGDKNGR